MHSFDEWFDSRKFTYGVAQRDVAFAAWTVARQSQCGLVMDICKAYEEGKADRYAPYPLGSVEHNAYRHGVSVAADARAATLAAAGIADMRSNG